MNLSREGGHRREDSHRREDGHRREDSRPREDTGGAMVAPPVRPDDVHEKTVVYGKTGRRA
jgi:hypothetical protein